MVEISNSSLIACVTFYRTAGYVTAPSSFARETAATAIFAINQQRQQRMISQDDLGKEYVRARALRRRSSLQRAPSFVES